MFLLILILSQERIPEVRLNTEKPTPDTLDADTLRMAATQGKPRPRAFPGDYLMPTKLFLVPTANILPSKTFWLTGGVSMGSAEAFQENGIFQGVVGLGLGNIVEGRFMLAGVLTNLTTGALVAPTASFKFQLFQQTKRVPGSMALELRSTPGYHYRYSGLTRYGVKFGFLYGMLGRDWGDWELHGGVNLAEYKIMTVNQGNGDSTLNNYNFIGGAVGLQKFRSNNTVLMLEFQTVPKVSFRTGAGEAEKLVTMYAVLGGVRFFFSPNWSTDAGLFYAGEWGDGSDREFGISDMMVYSNLHFLFTWDGLVSFFKGTG